MDRVSEQRAMHDPQVMLYVRSILQFIQTLSDLVRERVAVMKALDRQQYATAFAALSMIVDDLLALPIPPACMQLHRDCWHLFRTSMNLMRAVWDTDECYRFARAEQQEAVIAIEYEITRLTALYGALI